MFINLHLTFLYERFNIGLVLRVSINKCREYSIKRENTEKC